MQKQTSEKYIFITYALDIFRPNHELNMESYLPKYLKPALTVDLAFGFSWRVGATKNTADDG